MFNLILLIGLCHADGNVITLKKGDSAPFDGTLLDKDASISILVEQKKSLDTCLIESETQKKLNELDHKLEVGLIKAELDSCTKRSEQILSIKNDQIKLLEKQIIKPNWKSMGIYAGGVLTGIATVMASSWALGNISDN